jgi:hypothetical protein
MSSDLDLAYWSMYGSRHHHLPSIGDSSIGTLRSEKPTRTRLTFALALHHRDQSIISLNLDSRCNRLSDDDWMHVTKYRNPNRLDDAKVHWTALAGRPRAATGTVHCWTSLTAIAVHCCTFASEACQAGLRPHPIPRSTAKRWWNKVKPERISRSGCLGRIEP